MAPAELPAARVQHAHMVEHTLYSAIFLDQYCAYDSRDWRATSLLLRPGAEPAVRGLSKSCQQESRGKPCCVETLCLEEYKRTGHRATGHVACQTASGIKHSIQRMVANSPEIAADTCLLAYQHTALQEHGRTTHRGRCAS
jgi:hypothetical protein